MSRTEGLTVAVSVSNAPDRARLGLPSSEVDRAMLTICTALVREGADVLYAGNGLNPLSKADNQLAALCKLLGIGLF